MMTAFDDPLREAGLRIEKNDDERRGAIGKNAGGFRSRGDETSHLIMIGGFSRKLID